MKIQKYHPSLASQLYHFESSDMYCDKEAIDLAKKETIHSTNWSKDALVQLKSITKLELLRYNLAMDKILLDQYQKIVSDEVESFYQKWDMHTFKDTQVSEVFYIFLNKAMI